MTFENLITDLQNLYLVYAAVLFVFGFVLKILFIDFGDKIKKTEDWKRFKIGTILMLTYCFGGIFMSKLPELFHHTGLGEIRTLKIGFLGALMTSALMFFYGGWHHFLRKKPLIKYRRTGFIFVVLLNGVLMVYSITNIFNPDNLGFYIVALSFLISPLAQLFLVIVQTFEIKTKEFDDHGPRGDDRPLVYKGMDKLIEGYVVLGRKIIPPFH